MAMTQIHEFHYVLPIHMIYNTFTVGFWLQFHVEIFNLMQCADDELHFNRQFDCQTQISA